MAEYSYLYNTQGWKSLRLKALRRDLYECQECGTLCLTGRPQHPRNAVVDHILAHRGDTELFFDLANLQTLHKACHDGMKQAQEKGDRMQRADGWKPLGV